MDIKDIFDRAMSAQLDAHPFSDNNTVMKNIRERAKKMEKNKKIGHRILSAAAGTAAAAAFITGGYFGVRYLNEHGGLKEGGIRTDLPGAAYHAEETTSEVTDESSAFLNNSDLVIGPEVQLEDLYGMKKDKEQELETLQNEKEAALRELENRNEKIQRLIYEIDEARNNEESSANDELISDLEAKADYLRMEADALENKIAEHDKFIEYLNEILKMLDDEIAELEVRHDMLSDAENAGPEEADAKAEIDAAGKALNGVVSMDETIELGEMTVHFTGYDYDSQFIRFEYDVRYTDGEYHQSRNPLSVINLESSQVCSHGAWKYERGEESDIIHCHTDVAINGTPDYIRVPFGYTVFPEDLPAEPYTEDDELFAITVHFDPDSAIRTFWNDRVKVGETGKEFKISDAFITPTHISARLHFNDLTAEFADNITAGLRLMNERTVELTDIGIYGCSEDSDLYWLVAWYDEPIALDDIADANINGFYFSEPDEEYFELMKAKYPDICSIEHSPLYTPADEWYDCDGKRVHVTGYTFDGVMLRLRYETCHDYPLSGDAAAIYGYMLPNKLWDGFAYLCNGECDESRISEGIIAETFNVFVTSPVESLDIPFGDSIFTVHKNESVPMIEKDIDKEMSVSNGDTIHFDRLVLSSGNLGIAMSGSPYTNDYSSETGTTYLEALSGLQTVITLVNGDTIQFNHGWNEPAGMGLPNGSGYKFYQFTDPIDINDVVSITVNDMEIYSLE